MEARLDFFGNKAMSKAFKHIIAASKSVADTELPGQTVELVLLRASQINGCSVCIDMHAKDAVAGGESWERLNMVAGWREAKVFTEAERAALELAEEGTRIADGAGGVSDEVWGRAAKHYDEEQLGALVAAIAVINAFNRGNVMLQNPGGDYVPGQWS
ncbi:carboxymuconolactone decarboxylase family protein [Streptomyces boninensis]|uniref:carboxymuconolactone decarboxylase family protein n=1 Tax=Streptomyces boninensis TaxID=2039455 RepID=UPI003B228822